MVDVAKKTLASIKQKNIRPVPRWCVLGKRYLCWGSAVLAVASGALIGSVVFLLIRQFDWDVIDLRSHTGWHTLFIVIPYFWVIVLLLLLALAILLIRRTSRGYRLESLHLVALTAALVIAIGALATALKVHEEVNYWMASHLSIYDSTMNGRKTAWSHPEHGMLGGEVDGKQESVIFVRDFKGWCCWEVVVDRDTKIQALKEGVVVKRKIRVIGMPLEDHRFKALEVKPWDDVWLHQGGENPQIP